MTILRMSFLKHVGHALENFFDPERFVNDIFNAASKNAGFRTLFKITRHKHHLYFRVYLDKFVEHFLAPHERHSLNPR